MKKTQIQNELESVKEKMEILWSTLLAIHVAETENVYDGMMYVAAIHGAASQAQEIIGALQGILNDFTKEKASL